MLKECYGTTNCYIHYAPIYNINDELSFLADKKCIIDKTPKQLTYEDFFLQLAEYEKVNGKKYSEDSGYKNRHAISLDVMIPHEFNEDQLRNFSIKFIKDGLNIKLPYAAFEYKHKKGRYIRFLISEREYHAEGIELKKVALKDTYINSVTGYFCKATDKNAVKKRSKGEVISTSIVNFSLKTNAFHFPPNAFDELVKFLKTEVINILKSCGAIFHRVLSAKKLDRHNKNRFIQRQITCVNALIQNVEERVEWFYDALCKCHLIDYKESKAYYSLIQKYSKILNNRQYKLNDKVTLYLTCNLKYKCLKENCESVKEAFERDFTLAYNQIFC